jgi:hypothetical protein
MPQSTQCIANACTWKFSVAKTTLHVKARADARLSLCGIWIKEGFVVLTDLKMAGDNPLCKQCVRIASYYHGVHLA